MECREKYTNRKLVDFLGRKITYLRLSLTEQCNLKCSYCYGNAICKPSADYPTNDEIIKLLRIFSSLGVEKIRFTGGEPLLRKGLSEIVRETSRLKGIRHIGITTNGLILEPLLDKLIDSGLNKLNISLDSFDRETYKKITGVDGLDRVLSSIEAAERSKAFPFLKINSVIMKGVNDNEIPQMVEWALKRDIDLRFIEFMPTETSGWGREHFVSEDEIRERINFELSKVPVDENSRGPAVTYRCFDYPGRISFISAVSRSFCSTCNRLRINSKGDLIGCLFKNNSINLREYLGKYKNLDDFENLLTNAVNSPEFRRIPEISSVSMFKPSMLSTGG
ncbi:MAG: GTP 3',8-cyclase MoaA [candidate division Zixibacteria bacterium]|nr:GTP 3',8-cyclase MoaA [candidate division Zixibacteria bacterium]